MSQLQLTNVIDVSVSQAGVGAGEYNTSNLAIFTDEQYQPSFGTDGYKIYLSPIEVAEDFGSSSNTYKQALAVFSQNPNILAGGGYLVVIPMDVEIQDVAFGATPTAGSFRLNYGLLQTGLIDFNDSAASIQSELRAIPGLEKVTVTGSIPAGLVINFYGVTGDIGLLTVSNNTLVDAMMAAVSVTVTETQAGLGPDAAITATVDLVQYFGLMFSSLLSQSQMLACAAVVQALNKIEFIVSNDPASVDPGGALDLLRSGGFTQSRGLFYGGTDIEALVMQASYAGRALSTNFSGSNTTQTMHLKDLQGVQPDASMTQTLLNKCKLAGADTYISLQGIPKVFCSGENSFFDQVYNLQWFVGALQIAGFNALAQVGTKIPQTEQGMAILKSSYRAVCEQAVTNAYSAAGKWTSPTTFGNLEDFYANISQIGYYIYSIPVAQQLPTDRAARIAPLVQIALKEAGAIHSSNVIVNVNA